MSTAKVIEFVRLIETFPCLYNNSLTDYSRKDVTEKAWAEISSKINWTVPECKEKWRNVRNGFVKSLKSLPSGSAAKSRKQYYLHDEMQFVIPFVKPTNNEKEPGNIPPSSSQTTDNSLDDVDTHNSPTNEVETQRTPTNEEAVSTQPPTRRDKTSNNVVNSTFMQYIATKRQNIEKSMHRADTENPRKMFLLSLLPDIENLNNNNMRLLKIEMMTLIQKYQMAQQNQQSSSTAEINSDIYQQPRRQTHTRASSDMSPNQEQPLQLQYSPISSVMSPIQQQQPYSAVSLTMTSNQEGEQLVRPPLDYRTSRDDSQLSNDLNVNELTEYNWNENTD